MILIADPQYLTGKSLQILLQENGHETEWWQGQNTSELLKIVGTMQSELLISEYGPDKPVNTAGLRQLRSDNPSLKIMLISDEHSQPLINQALDAGIEGFLTKQCSKEEIVNAVNSILHGSKFFCNKVLDVILEKGENKKDDCSPTQLSNRELEIITLLTQGLNTKAIAEKLNLSQHTIYTHRKNIMKKLSLSSAQELIIYAMNTGLVTT